MRILLDSRDHIVLIERWNREKTNAFEMKLRKISANLVFSMHNILECCPPILNREIQTNVMRTLNRLERMPHFYIADAKIKKLEIIEATKAFLKMREYQNINPFVARFDYVLSPFERPATSDYINYSLPEIIFDLWQVAPDLLEGYDNEFKNLREILTSDRKRNDYKKHRRNFPNTIERDLALYNIAFPQEKIIELSKWIWAHPGRCPATRLGYEVFHKILRNLRDKAKKSDIHDLANIDCIPYVDVLTTDRRMRGYINKVDQSIGTSYADKVYRNIDEINTLIDCNLSKV